MSEQPPRTVAASEVTLTQMMEVTDANITGNVHGGAIMRLVDTAAALAAIKHSGGEALTVQIDEMSFLEPVHIGEVLILKASVNDVGRTSMECGVRVDAQDPLTGTIRHVNSAYLVFVAVDRSGRPREVPACSPRPTSSGAGSRRPSSVGSAGRRIGRRSGRRGRPRASAGPEPSPGTHATRGVWM